MLGSFISSLLGTLRGRRLSRSDLPRSDPIDTAHDGFLIRLDYPYRPCRRPLNQSRSEIFRLIAGGSDRYCNFLERLTKLAPYFERIAMHADAQNSLAPSW